MIMNDNLNPRNGTDGQYIPIDSFTMNKQLTINATNAMDKDIAITTVTENENGTKTVKLNREIFADWNSNATNRSADEETELKPRLTHSPRPTNRKGKFIESIGYYSIRKLAFDMTKGEYRTPQNNLDLIVKTFNEKTKTTNPIVRTSYIARTFTVRVFFADDVDANFIALDVSRPLDASKTFERLLKRSTGK